MTLINLLLFPLKILLISIDIVLIVITFRWVGMIKKLVSKGHLRSVPLNDDPSHRVHPQYPVEHTGEGEDTLYDLARDAFDRYGGRNCMGEREFLGWKVPGKVKNFGPDIKWRTYAQIGEDAHKFGAALREAGMEPAPQKTTLDKNTAPCRMAIFENTCAAWMVAALGAFTQSITTVTVYATLGMDAVVEAVQDNSIPVIVCNRTNVKKLIERINDMPVLTHIVYTNDLVSPEDQKEDVPKSDKVKVVSMDDFIKSGDTKKHPATPPSADTCAVVMYTSGSTGKPKGVVIKHSQIVACVAAAKISLTVRAGEDVYLAYLPLAHILELMAEFVFVCMGCTLCYADPKTLTSTGSHPIGALEHYSPTLMAAVPKIWDVIKKGIQTKVSSGSPIKLYLFNTAMQWRKFLLPLGLDTPLFNLLVFKKVKAIVGGKLRYALSGGGHLNGEVHDFIRAVFGIDFVQGYGLTETCAGLTIQAPDDFRSSIAGVPIPSIEIKLESTPDIGDKAGQPYLDRDRHDVDGNPVFGRGEILCKGPSLASGYYMMTKETKEAFEEDGWFHTGDIGQFMSDGSLRIVDRKKNLVKLKGGEYIALEKMEMVYGNSDFVDAIAGGVCCFGDGDMDRPIALIQLNEANATKWARNHNMSDDIEKIKKSEEFQKVVLDDLNKHHARSDLSHLEKLAGVALLTEHWTPENGCLTAANKLQRRTVVQKFEKEFDEVKQKGVFN